MQAVLYVAHGTRVAAGIEEARAFVERAKKRTRLPIQEMCFLELAEPTIEQGVANCVAQGATSIAIVPILLLTANHAKEDIPDAIEPLKARFPHIRFSYGKPFGIDRRLILQLFQRIQESHEKLTEDSEVLLIGRGSSDPAVLRDFTEIATRLKLFFGVRNVNIAFLYGNGPKFEDYVANLQQNRAKKIFIVPYLLFQGLLRKHIEKTIAEAEVEQQLVICESLGYGNKVLDVLVERTNEAVANATNINNEVIIHGFTSRKQSIYRATGEAIK